MGFLFMNKVRRGSSASKKASTEALVQLIGQLKPGDVGGLIVVAKKMLRKRAEK